LFGLLVLVKGGGVRPGSLPMTCGGADLENQGLIQDRSQAVAWWLLEGSRSPWHAPKIPLVVPVIRRRKGIRADSIDTGARRLDEPNPDAHHSVFSGCTLMRSGSLLARKHLLHISHLKKVDVGVRAFLWPVSALTGEPHSISPSPSGEPIPKRAENSSEFVPGGFFDTKCCSVLRGWVRIRFGSARPGPVGSERCETRTCPQRIDFSDTLRLFGMGLHHPSL